MAKDTLARGARSATFGPPRVTQEKWDAIFDTYNPTKTFIKIKEKSPFTACTPELEK